MLIGYLLLTGFIILQGILYLIKPISFFKYFFLICSCITMILIASLRTPFFVADDIGYLRIFWSDNNVCYFEWGFCQLNNLIKLIGLQTYVYFGILACGVFIPTWIFICKYSKNVVLSVLVYVCLMYAFNAVNGIRQFLAFSLVLLSFPFVLHRQFIKFFGVVMIACLFHKSVIICLSFYWLYNIKINFKNIFIFVLSTLIVCFAFAQLSDLYIHMGGLYANYISAEAEQGHLSTIIRLILNITIASFCLIFSKRKVR